MKSILTGTAWLSDKNRVRDYLAKMFALWALFKSDNQSLIVRGKNSDSVYASKCRGGTQRVLELMAIRTQSPGAKAMVHAGRTTE